MSEETEVEQANKEVSDAQADDRTNGVSTEQQEAEAAGSGIEEEAAAQE